MRASAFKYAVLSTVATLILVVIAIMPFHALLTVWAASNFGHYTAFRLWKEVILLVSGLGVLYLVIFDNKIRAHTLSRRLVQLIIIYMCLQVAWGLLAYSQHTVGLKAVAYGLLINLRFLAFFLIAWAISVRTARLRAAGYNTLLIPALIVVIFGLLQIFVLPNDFLRHFGYGPQTILPYETINHNNHYIRIISLERGANPLGAYLLLPISVLAVLIARGKRDWQRISLLLGAFVVLFFSFSRSAWLGAIVSLIIVVIASTASHTTRRRLLYVAGGGVLVLAVGIIAFRHSTDLQNVLLHTQTHSAVAQSSNTGHVSALRHGLRDVLGEPLGRGPGTAGPASVYNIHPARISENYFLQVAQEVGWLGLLLFLLINVGVAYLLWLRRADTLALSLVASLIGLTAVNCLSHAWTDDTLAYVWWGLAGIGMASLPREKKHEPPAA